MERELRPIVCRALRAAARGTRQRCVHHHPRVVAAVLLWAALHGRPAHRACDPRNRATTRLRPPGLARFRDGLGWRLYRARGSVERRFGNAGSFGGGLGPLPQWVRTLARVTRWAWCKRAIHAARVTRTRERLRQMQSVGQPWVRDAQDPIRLAFPHTPRHNPPPVLSRGGTAMHVRFTLSAALVVALFAGLSIAAPVPKACKHPPDEAAILGHWEAVSLTVNGVPQEVIGGLALTRGEFGPSPDARYVIDPAASPKTLDERIGSGGARFAGIYELDGDTFRWSFALTGDPRPTDFAPGDRRYVYEYRRVR